MLVCEKRLSSQTLMMIATKFLVITIFWLQFGCNVFCLLFVILCENRSIIAF